MIKQIQCLFIFMTFLSLNSIASPPSESVASKKLNTLVSAPHRSEENIARNQYRHPVETLAFFGITENMTVVEISPGGGWYTEILAPFLKNNGKYIAADYDPASKINYFRQSAKKFAEKIASSHELYGKVETTVMQVPDKLDFAENNSADMILSFRNTHNWASEGHADKVFAAIYKVLKPGGVFGLVQHRAGYSFPKDVGGKMGYLRTGDVIKMAEKAGFKLVERSQINANPKDTKDYKEGVWTLPPVYRMKDKDREKYKAIGESDRMTFKFVKVASE